SKFSLKNNPYSISQYNVNVTGVTKKFKLNSTTTNSSSSSFSLNSTSPVSSNATSPISSNATSPVSSKSASAAKLILNNKNYNLKVLAVSLHLDKNSIHPGDKQTITIRVLDKNSSNTVAGASVVGRITNPVGPFKKVGGTTDHSGKASYYWTV